MLSSQFASRFVGRDSELAELAGFTEAAGHQGAALLVVGDAGIGKTALLAQAAAVVGQARCLEVPGSQFGAAEPFSGLAAVLGPLIGEAPLVTAAQRLALEVALGRAEGIPPSRLQLATAALAVARHASRQRPVIIVADDAEWLDRPTLDVFLFMARRLAGSQAGMLLATRPEHAHLGRRGAIPVLTLGPLEPSASRQLVDERFPKLPESIRARAIEEAHGNPLALLELPAVIAARSARDASLPGVPAAGRLRAAFADRIERLPRPSRHLILLAAITRSGELRRLQSVFPGSLRDALASAERAGVLRVVDGRIVFAHPLLRTAAVELSPAQERKAAHRAIAAAFDDQPDQQAWHLAEAAEEPDEATAVRLEELAIRTARRGDAAGAAGALSRAADLSERRQERARRLTCAALVEASMGGDLTAVVRLLDDAEQADGAVMRRPEAAIASALLALSDEGDISGASRRLVTVLEGPETALGDHALGEALWILALACSAGGDPATWDDLRRLLTRNTARAPQWLATAVDVATTDGTSGLLLGARVKRAIDVLLQEDDPAAMARFGFLIADSGAASSLRAALSRATDAGARADGTATRLYALTALAYLAWISGDWDECERVTDRAMAFCAKHPQPLCSWHLSAIRARLAAARGDRAILHTLTAEMVSWSQPRDALRIAGLAHHALTLDALGRGRYVAAYRYANALLAPDAWPGRDGRTLAMALDLTEAEIRGGPERSAGTTAVMVANVDPSRLPGRLALVVRGAKALAASPPEASALFDAALSADEAAHTPFEWARVCLAYGEHLRERKSADRAVERLCMALAMFQVLGAEPWAERTAAALRACGEAVPAMNGPRPELLTAQERRIAEMAATGLSNAEIAHVLSVSANTVGSHLLRAYRKLNVGSRAALRDALTPPTSGLSLHGGEQAQQLAVQCGAGGQETG